MNSKIFTKGDLVLTNKNVVQKVKLNRVQHLSKAVAEEFNTYLNFGIFPTYADTYVPKYTYEGADKDGKGGKYVIADGDDKNGTPGVRSLFNRAGAVMLGASDKSKSYAADLRTGDATGANFWRISNNVPLIDSPKARQRIRKSSGCSVKELVTASQQGLMGQATYAYSDFMYCKHLGKVSNNYMVTLRRFPLPVDDYIGMFSDIDGIGNTMTTDKHGYAANSASLAYAARNTSCIGCMVTWMGVSGNEIGNILKYSYKMPFKEEEASWEGGQAADADASNGALSSMFSLFDSQYRAQYQSGVASTAGNNAFGYLGIGGLGDAPYKGLAGQRDERTKVWGPIDSIRHVYTRADKGLTFEQKISLVFEYELRSYNGINGRQAMLDLISNILNVTYTTGSFWGGGHKGFGAHQSNIFANLNIFKARGGFTNFVDSLAQDLTNLSGKIKSFLSDDPAKALKGLLNEVGGMLMSGILNKLGRPQKGMYNALLSPAPIGFWHVTIGNPKHPIMSIGNMVITNVQLEHNGPLGLDDFPTGLKVTVDLDRGKARDLRDIERLYMQGNDRIYSSMGDKVFDMYKNAELYKQCKLENKLDTYQPVSNIGDIKMADETIPEPTITVKDYNKLQGTMMKYFGTTDTYSIFIPAAEQEYGANKNKPSTEANKNK